METFYSTAIRRAELCKLDLSDLMADRGLLNIRQGKGKKDRIVPIGKRALTWIKKYLEQARPKGDGGEVLPVNNPKVGLALMPEDL